MIEIMELIPYIVMPIVTFATLHNIYLVVSMIWADENLIELYYITNHNIAVMVTLVVMYPFIAPTLAFLWFGLCVGIFIAAYLVLVYKARNHFWSEV